MEGYTDRKNKPEATWHGLVGWSSDWDDNPAWLSDFYEEMIKKTE